MEQTRYDELIAERIKLRIQLVSTERELQGRAYPYTPAQEAWLQALEEGRYTQDREYLRTPVGYCCLGVACEAVAGIKWELSSFEDGVGEPKTAFKVFANPYADGVGFLETETSHLPEIIRRTLGLRDRAGYFDADAALDAMKDLGLGLEPVAITKHWPVGNEQDTTNLAALNDCGWTHQEIAELIRMVPEVIFLQEGEEATN